MKARRRRVAAAGSARNLSLFVAVLAAIGCASVPATHYYVLEPHERAVSGGGRWRVGVRPFRVEPPYDGDRIVYRPAGGRPAVGFYEYHRWAVPLSRMMASLAAHAIEAVPAVAVAEPVGDGGDYDFYLSGRILALEEVDVPDGIAVRLAVRMRLTDARGRPVWSAAFEQEEPVTARNVPAVVEAMRAAALALHDRARNAIAGALAP